MTLVEVMITLGIASVLLLGILEIVQVSLKSTRNVSQMTEWNLLQSEIQAILASRNGCRNTFNQGNPLLAHTFTTTTGATTKLLAPSPTQIRFFTMKSKPPVLNPGDSGTTGSINIIRNAFNVTGIAATIRSGADPVRVGSWQPSADDTSPPQASSTDAWRVDYEVVLTGTKVAIGTNEKNYGVQTYSRTFPVAATVDGTTGNVLECATTLSADALCRNMGGTPSAGIPSCRFQSWIVADPDGYDAGVQMLTGVSGVNPPAGIYSQRGLVLPAKGTVFGGYGITFTESTGPYSIDSVGSIRTNSSETLTFYGTPKGTSREVHLINDLWIDQFTTPTLPFSKTIGSGRLLLKKVGSGVNPEGVLSLNNNESGYSGMQSIEIDSGSVFMSASTGVVSLNGAAGVVIGSSLEVTSKSIFRDDVEIDAAGGNVAHGCTHNKALSANFVTCSYPTQKALGGGGLCPGGSYLSSSLSTAGARNRWEVTCENLDGSGGATPVAAYIYCCVGVTD